MIEDWDLSPEDLREFSNEDSMDLYYEDYYEVDSDILSSHEDYIPITHFLLHGKRSLETIRHSTSLKKENVQGSTNIKHQILECTTLYTRKRTGNFGSLN